ncbi:hypothetical protein AB0F43_12365 [Kribbella sp. NPDC023972]|uniref:hypothetical protein n=1 Tax=Kribbella sp. NPDC023972 TaxID=3154795 RepID=UPI0033DDBC8D
MLNFLTGDDIYNHILMMRGVDPRAAMVLEGPTDCSALDPHLNSSQIYSIPGNGKPSVLRVVELVDLNQVKWVLGVIDSDRKPLPVRSDNLVQVDAYDLDTLIFSAQSVLSRVLSVVSDPDSRRAHLASSGCDTEFDAISRLARPVSALRHVSISESIGLGLDGFPIGEVADPKTLAVSLAGLIDLAAKRAKKPPKLPYADIEAKLVAELGTMASDDRGELCGHDLHGAAALLVRTAWGSRGNWSAKAIGQMMRSTLGCAQLMGTGLFEAIRRWGERQGLTSWLCPVCC